MADGLNRQSRARLLPLPRRHSAAPLRQRRGLLCDYQAPTTLPCGHPSTLEGNFLQISRAERR
ncbi:MAG: hypothetical protein LBB23_00955 [Rickettsiales bacterium]|nr:hypothetical protein [Rickettsiales bacterium]